MEPVPGGGRRCERCSRQVNDASELSEAELHALIERAETERVCLRSEVVGGRPRLASGVAAGLIAIALSGCALPSAKVEVPRDGVIASSPASVTGEGSIIGVVRHERTNEPLADAIVVLQSLELPEQLESMTNAEGLYAFEDLPPGDYTVQVLSGKANVSKVFELPHGAKYRSNFVLDPDEDWVMVGALIPKRTIPMDASSTYHSSMIWP